MGLVLTTLNCDLDTGLKCKNCNTQYRRVTVAPCPKMKNITDVKRIDPPVVDSNIIITKTKVITKYHRPRTDEEYIYITNICNNCEFLTESQTCGILENSCTTCRKQIAFAKFKKSGKGCPVGIFPSTEEIVHEI